MDPQLLAIRKARKEQFEAQKRTAEAARLSDTSISSPVEKPALPPNSSLQGTREAVAAKAASSIIQGLPSHLLNAPISSLLADAPAPPVKRPRSDDQALRVPPGRTAEIKRLFAQAPPKDLKILSWNIDGLDEVGGPQALMLRTLEVAVAVARHRPAVVLLQEAVPPALDLLSAPQVLGNVYDFVVPEDPPMPYYVAILFDKKLVKTVDKTEVQFPTTRMGRQLLSVTFDVLGRNSLPLVVCTAHLESTKDFAAERKKQLAICFRHLQQVFQKRKIGAAVLGGDLNIRDEEVKAVQKELGTSIADAWAFCGANENERWTWDTVANDNISVPFRSKCRFDRMFFVSPGISDKSATLHKLMVQAAAKPVQGLSAESPHAWRPLSFCLVGKERVPDLGRFPSDHWGMLTSWDFPSGKPVETNPASSTCIGAAASGHSDGTSTSNSKVDIQTPSNLDDEDEDLKAAIALSLGMNADVQPQRSSAFQTLSKSSSVIDLDA